MLEFFTPRWWCTTAKETQQSLEEVWWSQQSQLLLRSLSESLWSHHTAAELRKPCLQGCCVPLPFPAEGKEQESLQVCITRCQGCLSPAGTLPASKQTGRIQIKYQTMLDLQSLQMERLMPLGQTTNWHQRKSSVKFIFSPFPLLPFVQKFLAVTHSKS